MQLHCQLSSNKATILWTTCSYTFRSVPDVLPYLQETMHILPCPRSSSSRCATQRDLIQDCSGFMSVCLAWIKQWAVLDVLFLWNRFCTFVELLYQESDLYELFKRIMIQVFRWVLRLSGEGFPIQWLNWDGTHFHTSAPCGSSLGPNGMLVARHLCTTLVKKPCCGPRPQSLLILI